MNTHAVLHQHNLGILAIQRDRDGLGTLSDQGDCPDTRLKKFMRARTGVARSSAILPWDSHLGDVGNVRLLRPIVRLLLCCKNLTKHLNHPSH